MQEAERLKKRFAELRQRAAFGSYITYTDFLGLEEQNILRQCCFENEYTLFGGFDGAERVIAAFGEHAEQQSYPICCICVSPKQEKFADALTHRDYLGTLMGLGIKRSVLGDILIVGKTGYVFCLDTISTFICENLTRVRHTDVHCSITLSVPEEALPMPEYTELVVSSLRLDALVAAVYKLSRSEADKLFLQQKVFENGKEITDRSHIAKAGAKISVRGYGRFVFKEALRHTKKNRIAAALEIY